MCGRYGLIKQHGEIEGAFDVALDPSWIFPRYNIAPTQEVLTIVGEGSRRAEMMRWGLIPSWAKDTKIDYKTINARAETVAGKPAFRSAFKLRRCLVVADSFYEWRRSDKIRTPFHIGLKSWEPFAFAGLWEAWRSPEDGWVQSCSILTTEANQLVGRIHTRMPVMLPKEAESIWLDPESGPGDLRELLVPNDASEMEAYEVSALVNKATNEVPEVASPVSRLV